MLLFSSCWSWKETPVYIPSEENILLIAVAFEIIQQLSSATQQKRTSAVAAGINYKADN